MRFRLPCSADPLSRRDTSARCEGIPRRRSFTTAMTSISSGWAWKPKGQATLKRRLTRPPWKEIEKSVWRRVDVVLYPSPEETAVASSLSARAATIVPYAYEEFGDGREPATNHEILFVAGFGHPPNVDAAVWLADDVMKLIWAQVPDATLSLVGANPSRGGALACDRPSRGQGSGQRGRTQGAVRPGSDRDGAASNGRGRQIEGGRSAAGGVAARHHERRAPKACPASKSASASPTTRAVWPTPR